jgi:hypothetical protein
MSPTFQAPRSIRTTTGGSTPILSEQAVAIARQSCARIFRDGGAPGDALAAFGLAGADDGALDWRRTVDLIAAGLSASTVSAPARRAA